MDERDRRVRKSDLDAEVSALNRHATVASLKTNAAELTRLYEAMSKDDRARLLALAFGDESEPLTRIPVSRRGCM